jgi:glycerol-3-phosphate acyltransferase PlsX
MPQKTIAIDAMTNEKGKTSLLNAINQTLKKHKDLEVILVGDNSIRHLEQPRISIEAAPEIIKGGDSLKQILHKLESSSTYVAAELVKEARADIGLSFGDTKAVGLAVSKNLEPLNGLKKVPLAAAVPSKKGKKYTPTLCLDIGGTGLDDVSPRNLLEFGILAKYYMRQRGLIKPKIGLLSNGEEKSKGTNMTRKAYELYQNYAEKTGSFDYIGFVEGREVFVGGENKPDIVVTDGHTGNILLKMSEGLGLLYKEILHDSFRANLATNVASLTAKFTGVFRSVKKTMNPDQYGGAIFLGLSRPFVKGHGASNEFAIRTAIDLAYNYANHLFLEETILEETIKELKQVREYSR